MTLVINSDDLAPVDMVDAIHHVVCDSVVKVEIDFEPGRPVDQIQFAATLTNYAQMVSLSIQHSPATTTRTPRLAREDIEPTVIVQLQKSGASSIVQNERIVSLEPGDFAIFDTSAPYTLHSQEHTDQLYFRIPRAALVLPETSIQKLTATSLGKHSIGRFVASYLGQLATSTELQASEQAALVAEPTINLLRAALSTQLADLKNSRPALEATLELRVIDYMTRHLAEPDLTVTRLAAAHHISVRYLYVVLARAGIAPGEWIRTRRLDACRHELTMPGAAHQTISAIAAKWGFPDGSQFGRMFKSAYGLSPSEWRDLSRPTGHSHGH
jgi:AraC-like DNA-binding protein